MPSNQKAQLNQSLIDGIITLQALTLSVEPVGCRDLARRLGMDPARVYRLLQTLTHMGIARQTKKRKYIAGPGMHALSAQNLFASNLIQNAIEPLELLQKYGHSIALGVLWRDNITYLYHALPGMPSIQALGRTGFFPASGEGVGMALLSTLKDEQIMEIYASKEIPHYPNGIESLLKEIHIIRNQGYAYIETDLEHNHAIAIPIGNPAHSAIGLSGSIPPTSTAELIEALRNVAIMIEKNASL